MDSKRFDDLIRRLGRKQSRRSVLRTGAGAAAVAIAAKATATLAAPKPKVQICHFTGSATNPVNLIEVSQNAVQAHLDHGDTEYGNCCTDEVCITPNPCTIDSCQGGWCDYSPIEDGTPCDVGGTCQAGECVIVTCAGDWEFCSTNEDCCSGVCTCGANEEAGHCAASFYQGFDTDASGWSGVTAGGGVGSVAINGGAFSRLGGYTNVFPGSGWTVSLDIYLDMALADGSDLRVAYTAAANGIDCAHRRDFVFSIGTDPNAVGQFAISASNNAPGWPSDSNRSPIFVATSGWYTFTHVFENAGDDSLGVAMSVSGPGGSGYWYLNDGSDIIGSTVGGNRYAWFYSNDFALAIDSSQRY